MIEQIILFSYNQQWSSCYLVKVEGEFFVTLHFKDDLHLHCRKKLTCRYQVCLTECVQKVNNVIVIFLMLCNARKDR